MRSKTRDRYWIIHRRVDRSVLLNSDGIAIDSLHVQLSHLINGLHTLVWSSSRIDSPKLKSLARCCKEEMSLRENPQSYAQVEVQPVLHPSTSSDPAWSSTREPVLIQPGYHLVYQGLIQPWPSTSVPWSNPPGLRLDSTFYSDGPISSDSVSLPDNPSSAYREEVSWSADSCGTGEKPGSLSSSPQYTVDVVQLFQDHDMGESSMVRDHDMRESSMVRDHDMVESSMVRDHDMT
ncbi:hypothetical protein Tco_1482985 [Tanacetum coccineum]